MKRRNSIWPFTEEQVLINRCAMKDLPPNHGERKCLRVSTEYFTAGAEFEKVCGRWECVETAPILRWMRGKGPADIKLCLLRMNAQWEWINRSPTIKGDAHGVTGPQVSGVCAGALQIKPQDVVSQGYSRDLSGPSVASLSLPTGAQPRATHPSGQVIAGLEPTAAVP